MSERRPQVNNANRRTTTKLVVVVLAMFGFGYALVPMYNVFCSITGANGKTRRTDAAAAEAAVVDTSRMITVQFTTAVMGAMPWEFRPEVTSVQVHPGELATVNFYAHNMADFAIVGQAIPSVAPGNAAAHFKKTECFCFTRQSLNAGEVRHMPVRFLVDADVPKNVNTITLSYAFFNIAEGVPATAAEAGATHSGAAAIGSSVGNNKISLEELQFKLKGI
jgi:cytochrome c oxidase assembly protein subunit 11